MTPKFSVGEVLFNRDTKEKGRVVRVCESSGITMYEVSIWADFQGYGVASNASDWAEDVLELSVNR